MQPTNTFLRSLACAVGLALLLAGCSEYTDRRETIALSGGNALATDRLTEMVDPWPAASADRNIAFNGSKMQSAVQRYRTNQIIQPNGNSTSGSYSQQGSGNPPAASDPTASQPATPKSP
jgi:PBP1b-binding outer membrane lipoprotein LpoB